MTERRVARGVLDRRSILGAARLRRVDAVHGTGVGRGRRPARAGRVNGYDLLLREGRQERESLLLELVDPSERTGADQHAPFRSGRASRSSPSPACEPARRSRRDRSGRSRNCLHAVPVWGWSKEKVTSTAGAGGRGRSAPLLILRLPPGLGARLGRPLRLRLGRRARRKGRGSRRGPGDSGRRIDRQRRDLGKIGIEKSSGSRPRESDFVDASLPGSPRQQAASSMSERANVNLGGVEENDPLSRRDLPSRAARRRRSRPRRFRRREARSPRCTPPPDRRRSQKPLMPDRRCRFSVGRRSDEKPPLAERESIDLGLLGGEDRLELPLSSR
jgi:hypothetical protein